MPRLQQSLADYVVVAISPALIMALVGSLVFFLLEVFYQGEYQARLCYIFALFVFATVLIGRISIEEGANHATLFALPMGMVTALAIMRFVQFQADVPFFVHVVINLGLMGLVWFAAHQLTYDCTVVDETLDGSGAGLLDILKWFRRDASPATEQSSRSWLQWAHETGMAIYAWLNRPRTTHVLGRWVIYFAAATLPLFGVGQLFIPAADVGRRRYVLLLLGIYVASALGLLLTTSFLSLRRYLRQKQLEMPITMTGAWLTVGGSLLVGTLLVAAILPRPAAEYEIAQLPISFGSPGQKKTSQQAPKSKDGVEDQQNKSGETKHDPKAEQTVDGKQGDKQDAKSREKSDTSGGEDQGKSGESQSKPGDGQQPKGSGEKADQPKADRPKAEQPKNDQPNSDPAKSSEQSSPPPAQPSAPPRLNLSGGLTTLLRWLILAALVIIAAVAMFIYRAELLAALRQLWAELVAAWQRLMGRYAQASQDGENAVSTSVKQPRKLTEFSNPFVTGHAQRMTPTELVQYTFAALEAWGREHDCVHLAEQTPLEFASHVGRKSPPLAQESLRLAEMYSMLAYGSSQLSSRSNEQLRALWQMLQS